jgi:hypothetical protein
MHTYLLRLLIAAITFTVGVAISSLPFLSNGSKQVNYERRSYGWNRHCGSASVGIRQDESEPLRLIYVKTNDGFGQQIAISAQNDSGREVSNFTISYVSRWRHSPSGGGGAVQSGVASGGSILHAGESQTVNIDSTPDQLTWVWLSSVDFADGSRWENGRYNSYMSDYQ